MIRSLFCFIAVGLSALFGSQCPAATPALSISGGPGGTPNENTVHGWEFVVNRPVHVTHLGLYDREGDGFLIDHPIGIFRLSDSTLLVDGALKAGGISTLRDGFRYIDTADIQLTPGETYVVAYHSSEGDRDWIVTTPNDLTFHSAVTWTASRFDVAAFGLPTTRQVNNHKIGPNFLIAIPEPSAICLACSLLLGCCLFVRSER